MLEIFVAWWFLCQPRKITYGTGNNVVIVKLSSL